MVKRIVIHTYKKHDSLKTNFCYYCGDWAESKDHIPPISYPDEVKEDERIMVRCCILCNSLLGNKYFLTLLERCDYLFAKYQNRFKKLLGMPNWTIQEIKELTGRLKRKIILDAKRKKHIEHKLTFIKNNIVILQGYD